MRIQQFNQDLFIAPALVGKPDGTIVSVPHPSGVDSRKIPWLYSALKSYNGRGGSFRPCLHSKAVYGLDSAAADVFTSTIDPVRFTANTANWAINSVVDAVHSLSVNRPAEYVITDALWGDYASDAMEAMKPSLTSNNSLINFILELKDFKRIGAEITNLFKSRRSLEAAKQFNFGFFGNRPWNAPRSKRTKSQKVSDAWLEWKLAWQPFVNDVGKLVSGITSFEHDVRQFLHREGKRQQRYWGRSVPPQFSEAVLATGSYIPPDIKVLNNLDIIWRWTIKEVVQSEPRFHATMRYRYQLDDRLRAEARTLNGFLDRLGINGNPAILWNALPFSFVVDWFVNVGGYLNKLRVDNVRPVTEVSDFCSSVKSERRLELVLSGDILGTSSSAAVVNAVAPKTVFSSNASWYRREAFLPRTSLSFGSGLSGQRIITAAALVNSLRR